MPSNGWSEVTSSLPLDSGAVETHSLETLLASPDRNPMGMNWNTDSDPAFIAQHHHPQTGSGAHQVTFLQGGSAEGSNLCGETPLDFESNALTTRPSQPQVLRFQPHCFDPAAYIKHLYSYSCNAPR
ncbi:hypothetical protein JZ751_025932 [Albula glossodonta]|uniref:Uncharacterized protein n=1 Tax=Albula glossodonta TaxID=121402 RepID=A0A8T2ND37_9TELE|nr:hypothetical protein JZ751_025932 [Albula glossodonta]